MSARRTEHDKFRNLFKTNNNNQGSKEQTSVNVGAHGRTRASSASPHSKAVKDHGVSKSHKSQKRKSGQRNKHSKQTGGHTPRTKCSVNPTTASPLKSPDRTQNSNRRASVSPHRSARPPRTPTTPPTNQATRPRTPTHGQGGGAKWNGQDIQEKTQFCPTVFENDAGAAGGGTQAGGGHIQLAAARIKERKLQWAPSAETSGGSMEASRDNSKEEIKEVVKTTRTIFENDDNHPAPVGEEKTKLQWATERATECMSEPELRKKKSGDEVVRGAVSDRPPRDHPPVKPPRHIPTAAANRAPPRTPVRTPPGAGAASTMTIVRSPSTRPVMLEPTSGTSHTYTGAGFGSGPGSSEKEERPASIYLAANMQHAAYSPAAAGYKKNDPVNSEPYETSPKKY